MALFTMITILMDCFLLETISLINPTQALNRHAIAEEAIAYHDEP